MRSFTLTRSAKSDLKSIARFTENRWGKTQRNIYVKQVDDAFHMLVDSPSAGTACEYIKDGYKKFPLGSHVIFYICDRDSEIKIIRILHKSMDVMSKLTAT